MVSIISMTVHWNRVVKVVLRLAGLGLFIFALLFAVGLWAGGPSFRAFAFCERVGSKCSIPHTRGFVTIFELTGSGFRNGNRGILESHPCGEAEKAKASFTPRACPERSRGDGPPSGVVREEKTKLPRLRKAGPPARQPRPAGKTAWQPGLHRLRHRDFRPAR